MKKKRMTSGILASAMMISALSLPMCVFAEDTTEQTDERQVIGTGSYVTYVASPSYSFRSDGLKVKVEWNFTLYDNNDFVVTAIPYHQGADGYNSWECIETNEGTVFPYFSKTTENLLWEKEDLFDNNKLLLGSMGFDGYTGEYDYIGDNDITYTADGDAEVLNNIEQTPDLYLWNKEETAEPYLQYLYYYGDEEYLENSLENVRDFNGVDAMKTVTDFSKNWDNAVTFTTSFYGAEDLQEIWAKKYPLFSITFHNWTNTQFDLAGERFRITDVKGEDGITKDIRGEYKSDALWSEPCYFEDYRGFYSNYVSEDDGVCYNHFVEGTNEENAYILLEWNTANYYTDAEGKRTRIVNYPNGDFTCGDKLYDDVVDYNYKYYSNGDLIVTARLAEGIEDIVLPDKHMNFGELICVNGHVYYGDDEYYSLPVYNYVALKEDFPVNIGKWCQFEELVKKMGEEKANDFMEQFAQNLYEDEYQALENVVVNKEGFTVEELRRRNTIVPLYIDAEKDTLHAGEELFSFGMTGGYLFDEVTICHSGTSFEVNPRNVGKSFIKASNDSVDGYQNGLPELEQVDNLCQPDIVPEFISDSDSEPTTEPTEPTTIGENEYSGFFACDGVLHQSPIDYQYKFCDDGAIEITVSISKDAPDITVPDNHLDFGKFGIPYGSYEIYPEDEFVGKVTFTETDWESISEGKELTEEMKNQLSGIKPFTSVSLTLDENVNMLQRGKKLFSFKIRPDDDSLETGKIVLCQSGFAIEVEYEGDYQNGNAQMKTCCAYDNRADDDLLYEICKLSLPEYSKLNVYTKSKPLTVTKYGDVDCDGDVSILDVILANRNILGKSTVTKQGAINGDLDSSGALEPNDSLSIMKLIVGILKEEDFQTDQTEEPTEDETEETSTEATTETVENTTEK